MQTHLRIINRVIRSKDTKVSYRYKSIFQAKKYLIDTKVCALHKSILWIQKYLIEKCIV